MNKREIAILVLGLIIGFLISYFFINNKTELISPIYIEGRIDTVHITKIDTVKLYTKSEEVSIDKPTMNFADSSLYDKNIFLQDSLSKSDIDIKVITYPKTDSIKFNWTGSLETKTFYHIDTIIIKQIDTLKYTETKENHFDNFKTGFTTATFLILIIMVVL